MPTALAQVGLVDGSGEARGGDVGAVERGRAVDDPAGDRLAERRRDAEAADAAAAHHPGAGHAGQRPDEVAVVHRERRQPAAVLGDAEAGVLEDRELLAHAARQPPQHLDVERQPGDVVRHRLDLHRIRLVAAEHQPAALVAHVHVGVDDA